jgi:UDP-N-acetylmuramoyl-tripeptide--D-alanyl-D-alanine ligase
MTGNTSTRKPHPFWTIEGLRAASGGALLGDAQNLKAPIEGVSIDSRTLKPGEAFLALKGDRFDGADFVDAAIKAGARAVIGPESIGERTVPVIAIEDPITALARLAATWRDCLRSTRIVAVTGTNGKTTTVNLIHAACRDSIEGSASERSFNNHIGAPLTLLRARETDDYLVCEIGTSSPGEIAHLAGIIRPDIGVVTSIGFGHAQRLGGLDGVRVEKGALLRALDPAGVAIFPAGELDLIAFVEASTMLSFGSDIDADAVAGPTTVETIKDDDGSETIGISFTLNGERLVRLPLLGEHNARNAAAAFAVAEQLGVSAADAIAGLARVKAPAMRLERRDLASMRVINDAYNANPDSMAAAIDAVIAIPRSGRLVLVLGDMLELGEHAPSAHRRIGRMIGKLETTVALITIGPEAGLIAEGCKGAANVEILATLPDDADASIENAVAMLAPGDTVLLKASRGVRLERIVDRLIALELDPTAGQHATSGPTSA